MSKSIYIGINNGQTGIARKVKKLYVGVNGVARKIKKGYIGINGVARQFYSSGVTMTKYYAGFTGGESYTIKTYALQWYDDLSADQQIFSFMDCYTSYSFSSSTGVISGVGAISTVPSGKWYVYCIDGGTDTSMVQLTGTGNQLEYGTLARSYLKSEEEKTTPVTPYVGSAIGPVEVEDGKKPDEDNGYLYAGNYGQYIFMYYGGNYYAYK